MLAAPPGDAVPAWLQSLPAAPEYHPTAAEFADPVAYMLKIEPEASRFGICKIVPPLPAPPRAGTVTRLEASFADANAAAGEAGPTFTTRRQQVGLSPRSRRPACRAVWHSGERYTLSAFESKARLFARSVLPPHPKKPGARRAPLETEALFWRACAGRPTTVEYGNDMPGSGFAALGEGDGGAAAPRDVGETEWNMRRAPRAQGSLLRCMQRDVAGVTSPMVYVAMLFSWFAWHVEDHELHSLNYLHLGEPKTWYGVPRDAMLAFEDVVRVHGYSEEVNAIMTFEILNEKTTVMSPEVLLSAGVPCCRLVQNPGDFVITFPGAYHSGFSHGFNCGEATNIATPCWLRVAREAAIRRASTNCGPMVSHYQLLYELALSLLPRMPKNCNTEPRSSRLRDKMKNEGEMMVKETFVSSVIQNNNLLSILVDKGSCIIVPEVADPLASFSKAMAPEVNVKQRLSAPCISQQAAEEMLVEDVIVDESATIGHFGRSESANKTSSSACHRKKLYETKRGKLEVASFPLSTSEMQNGVIEKEHQGGGLLDQGRLPCVQCGILSFACVAIIQPGDAAVRFIMSRDCSSLDGNHGEISESDDISNWRSQHCEMVPQQGQASGTDDNWLSNIRMAQVSDRCRQLYSSNDNGCTSALGLLASAYEASDSEEEIPKDILTDGDKNDEANQRTAILETPNSCLGTFQHNGTDIHLYEEKCEARITSLMKPTEHNTKLLTRASFDTDISCYKGLGEPEPSYEQCSWYLFSVDDPATSGGNASSSNHTTSGKASLESDLTTIFKYNRDSSRMHVFCLEHALETWKQLQKIGGANIMLLCHPEYPRAELQAKVIAEELGMNYEWKHINFMEATKEDIGRIQLAWQDEDAEPTSSDWAVKMGINMYYSAKQSKSPLYSKQMPYNAIIYKAFGQENPDSLAEDTDQSLGGMKKRVVSGRWCGKVWTSNQVHPLLAREPDERSHEDIGYNEVSDWESKFSSNSRQNTQYELTKRSTLISSALSKTSFGRRRGKSYEKPRTKNRRTTDDEATLLHSGLGKNSEAIPKQQTNFSDYNEQEYDGIEIAPDTQPYQQPKLQNLSMKSRSKKRTGEKKNRRVQEELYEDNDVEHLIDIDSGDEAAVGTLDRSPQQKLGSTKIKLDGMKTKSKLKMQGAKRKSTKSQAHGLSDGDNEAEFSCDVEGCTMSFGSHHDLALHKRNICPLKGCKKKFFSHKYLLQHRKVHMDERPLKCPWKGCKKTFKWPWARTEHIRVHTGARPYVCKELGCGQTFRFVSDFSRHKRKTGHSCDKRKKAST